MVPGGGVWVLKGGGDDEGGVLWCNLLDRSLVDAGGNLKEEKDDE